MDKLKIFSPSYDAVPSNIIQQRNFKLIRNNTEYNYAHTQEKRTQIYSNIETNLIFSPKGVTISVNPSKWYLDNNDRQLTFTELQQFVPQFINYMGINNSDFWVTGLDFNQDIITDHKPAVYFPLLDRLPRFNRTQYNGNTGIMYQTKSRELVIYDKIAEMLAKGHAIPLGYRNQNRLRIEYCINRNFSNSKLKDIITLNDLTAPKNYNKIVGEWYRHFNNIHKLPTLNNDNPTKPDTMKIEDYAILNLIHQIGIEAYCNIVDTDHHKGLYNRNTAYEKKRKVKAIIERYNALNSPVNASEALQELNDKVTDRYQRSLQ